MKDEQFKFLYFITMRNTIYNLDIRIPENLEIFNSCVRKTIILHEGVRYEAYDDKTGTPINRFLEKNEKFYGNETTGIGFNMRASGAKDTWNRLLGSQVSFDEMLKGRFKLNQQQVQKLLDHTIAERITQLKHIYRYWDRLKPNEQAAIISAYFNCPALVSNNTNFKKHIENYLKVSDKKHLLAAVFELKNRSNPTNNKGLRVRRKCEATLLNSSEIQQQNLIAG